MPDLLELLKGAIGAGTDTAGDGGGLLAALKKKRNVLPGGAIPGMEGDAGAGADDFPSGGMPDAVPAASRPRIAPNAAAAGPLEALASPLPNTAITPQAPIPQPRMAEKSIKDEFLRRLGGDNNPNVVPRNAFDEERYDYATNGGKNDPRKRSIKTTLLSALAGADRAQRGAPGNPGAMLLGALTGGVGGTINPIAGRNSAFDDIQMPYLEQQKKEAESGEDRNIKNQQIIDLMRHRGALDQNAAARINRPIFRNGVLVDPTNGTVITDTRQSKIDAHGPYLRQWSPDTNTWEIVQDDNGDPVPSNAYTGIQQRAQNVEKTNASRERISTATNATREKIAGNAEAGKANRWNTQSANNKATTTTSAANTAARNATSVTNTNTRTAALTGGAPGAAQGGGKPLPAGFDLARYAADHKTTPDAAKAGLRNMGYKVQ